MRLLYAFPEPLPLPRARGLQVAHTVCALAASGLDVLLAHVPGEGDPFAASARCERGKVRVVALSRSLPWPLVRLHSNRFFFARLARLIERERPDALFLRHLKLARMLGVRFPQLPILYEAHEVFADTAPEKTRRAVSRVEAEVLEHAALVVANSGATAAGLRERYRLARDIAIVPNGVERPLACPSKDWSRPGDQIVYAGSLFPWKGAAEIVAAATGLPGCTITVVGGDVPEVERLRRSLSPDGANVVFLGRRPHAEVRALLEHSCIAVLPNRADEESRFTSPIKLFEYMAAGCAIVASDLAPIREILGEDDALWVRAGDAESLAQGIRALVADPERARQLGIRAFEKSAGYTWGARGAELARLLNALR